MITTYPDYHTVPTYELLDKATPDQVDMAVLLTCRDRLDLLALTFGDFIEIHDKPAHEREALRQLLFFLKWNGIASVADLKAYICRRPGGAKPKPNAHPNTAPTLSR